MAVSVPCDAVETRKATDYFLLEHFGPKYIRFAREATPIVTKEDTPFVFGKANVIRMRRKAEKMGDAFDTILTSRYKNEHEDLSIIGCGADGSRGDARSVHPEAGIWLRDTPDQPSHHETD